MRAARFNQRMAEYGDRIEGNYNSIRKEATAGMATDLIDDTPKDTEQASGNWRVGIGSRAAGFIRGALAAQAKSQARTAVAGAPAGARMIVSNDAPYIDRLNDGWSKQAPRGFVQAVVSNWRSWVRRQKVLTRVRKP